jgi:hypothetical protein
VVACPAKLIEITPAHKQLHLEESFKAGMLPIITVAEPGAQGVTVLGMQGIGVKTPKAAEVAAATVGLANELHIPKVGMFAKGWWSMIFAAGVPHMVLFVGATIRVAGATPKVHCIIAPIVTSFGIIDLSVSVLLP